MSFVSISNAFNSRNESEIVNSLTRRDAQNQLALKGCMGRIFAFKEKKALKEANTEFYNTLIENFKSQKNIPDVLKAKRILDLSIQGIWKPTQELSVGKLHKINKVFTNYLVYSGKGCAYKSSQTTLASKTLDFLFAQRDKIPAELFKWENAKNILLKTDPTLMADFRTELQNAFQKLFELTEEKNRPSDFVIKTCVGNLIGLIPYTYPSEGEVFKIPCLNGSWSQIEYTVEKKFNLTPSWFSSSMPAYGLTAQEASPLLAFLGTTFPAGEGFTATLLADFTPGLSVGHATYLSGKKEVLGWLKEKSDVKTFGISLGGALAFQFSRNHPQYFSEVNAYNPPGLYPWNKKHNDTMSVNIFSQENDFVSTMGFFPTGENVNFYEVLPQKMENFIKAHNRLYTHANEVTILKKDVSKENRRIDRTVLTFLHMVVGPIFLFLPIFFIHCVYKLVEMLMRLFSTLYELAKKRLSTKKAPTTESVV